MKRQLTLIISACFFVLSQSGCQSKATQTNDVPTADAQMKAMSAAATPPSGAAKPNKVESEALFGVWGLRNYRCSSGQEAKGVPTSGRLEITKSKFIWELSKDGKTHKMSSGPWILQENLLSIHVPNKAVTKISTMEVRQENPDHLELRFPQVGVPGECPPKDLMIATYGRPIGK